MAINKEAMEKMKKAGSTSKHKTRTNHRTDVMKGSNMSLYVSGQDQEYLLDITAKCGKIPRSKIFSLGLKLVRQKYGSIIDKNDLD